MGTTPRVTDVVVSQPYPCQIRAQRHIKVRALTAGYLEAVPAREGQAAKNGDVLFKVLPTLYKAKLDAERAGVQLAQLEAAARRVEDLTQPRVRSAAGEMVPLGNVLAVRKTLAPPAVVRVNGYRAVIVTAAPAAGKTPAEAAARCMNLAQEILPGGYHVKDLTGPPR